MKLLPLDFGKFQKTNTDLVSIGKRLERDLKKGDEKMSKTNISWTDESSNPIRFRRKDNGMMGWQCVKVNGRCKNCYAETMNLSTRISYGTKLPYTVQSMEMVEPVLIEKELHRLETSKALSGKKVFIEDMSDLFGDFIPYTMLDRLFEMFEKRQDVTFQLLTKRPQNMRIFINKEIRNLDNIWLGVSVGAAEDYKLAYDLMNIHAPHLWLSVEPLVEKISLFEMYDFIDRNGGRVGDIKWLVCGAESGENHRPFEIDWAENLQRECKEMNIAFFMKQDSGIRPGNRGRIPDSLWVKEFPYIPTIHEENMPSVKNENQLNLFNK